MTALAVQQPDRWGNAIIDQFPADLHGDLRHRWSGIAASGPKYPGLRHEGGLAPHARANQDLVAQWDAARKERLHIAFDDCEINDRAARAADLCRRLARLELMQDYARSIAVDPPEVGGRVTRVSAARRLMHPRWWRRQMRASYTRTAEAHLRALGVVHRRRQVYASDNAVRVRRQRQTRNSALLRELQAVSDAGDQLEMWDVVQASTSNPALRRAELMTRLRGFEEVAEAAGHVAEFVTATCPSAYHATLADGSANPRWAGFTPREGQQWLCKMWARARARLARLSVRLYGFRIAEPHHDGTPHWHMVLFMPAHHRKIVRLALAEFWLAEYGDEPGARKHRTTFKAIDPHKGSACGYVAKYVAKNIDGFEVGVDFETEGQAATQSADRVAAWASAHGIRQFQQLGGPQVTVWRELRRLREAGVQVGALEEARAAADAGEWAAFVSAVGGIDAGRAGAVQLWRETTGELNQYEELKAPEPVGVQCAGQRVRTRCKVWRIERKASAGCGRVIEESRSLHSGPVSSLGPVSITVRGSKTVPAMNVAGDMRFSDSRGVGWTN